jgi:hypothetical protein
MDLQEIKAKRAALEQAMLQLIQSYEQETQTLIEAVELDHVSAYGRIEATTVGVTVEIRL